MKVTQERLCCATSALGLHKAALYVFVCAILFIPPTAISAESSGGNISHEVAASRAAATPYSQIEEIKEEIKKLRGDIEQLQFDNARLNDKLVKMSADVEYRFNQSEKAKTESSTERKALDNIDSSLDNNSILSRGDGAKAATSTTTTAESMPREASKDPVLAKKFKEQNIEQEYQDAYSLLKDRDYKKAREAFKKFIATHATHDLVGSARYWVGETYFLEEDYEKSAIEYLKGYQASIRGSRAPDNLLKLAKSLAKSDKRKEEACVVLIKLKTEFPNAQNTIKKQMQDDMKALKCNVTSTKK